MIPRSQVTYKGVDLSTFDHNPNASIVHVAKSPNAVDCFGKIVAILDHQHTPLCSVSSTEFSEVWVFIEFFLPVPGSQPKLPSIQVGESRLFPELRLKKTGTAQPVHIREVLGKCAYLVCRPRQVCAELDAESVILVSL